MPDKEATITISGPVAVGKSTIAEAAVKHLQANGVLVTLGEMPDEDRERLQLLLTPVNVPPVPAPTYGVTINIDREAKLHKALKSELVWPVQVRFNMDKVKTVWLTTHQLDALIMPRHIGAASEYKQDIIVLDRPVAPMQLKLVGAWVSEPGVIICDRIELEE